MEKSNMQFHKGFSLVELLLVIILLGIMAVMGSAVWNRYITNTNFREAARAIEADMKFMKQNALSQAFTTEAIPNVTYNIVFDKTNNSYTLEAWDSATATNVFTRTRQLSSFGRGNIVFDSVPLGGPTYQLNFLRRGILGTIVIKNDRDSEANIRFTQSGKVYVAFDNK